MRDKEVKNILIIKPSSLGDILHAFPAVALIAELFPEARIEWLINRQFAPVLDFHPDVETLRRLILEGIR